MTLQELEQIQKDRANGIIVSRSTIQKVLDWAIELTKYMEERKRDPNSD